MSLINHILDALCLTKRASAVISTLSGGEKKRLSIASELVSDPSVLLLDEPTTGLDSSIAYTIMNALKDIAQDNRTIVFTIHQPSSQIFRLFDKLLLLADGRPAYFGAASSALAYFESFGLVSPPHYNPADFMRTSFDEWCNIPFSSC